MAIHKPQPVPSFREFLSEILVVVLGIIRALEMMGYRLSPAVTVADK
jgi:hypothetical protein